MNAVAQTTSVPAALEKTLADMVHQRARSDGGKIAYTFLADGAGEARSLTWAQLDARAAALAPSLVEKNAAGRSVLLALPSGLDFVVALFACWYAGAVAVPVSLPRYRRVKHRLDAIIADAGAQLAIGTADTRARVVADDTDTPAAALQWIEMTPAGDSLQPEQIPSPPVAKASDLAVLQYTSGSTGNPRGVMVSHANIVANSAQIAEACGHSSEDTIGGWLPLFHDMGLVGLLLQTAYIGGRCVFMSPERFLMRPHQWLTMISEYRVCSSPAPNFAYDLCVDRVTEEQKATLDLSCWRNALNGSEPVRASTFRRFAETFAPCGFRSTALFPCYGLAEATLFVTGPGERRELVTRSLTNESTTHVGCGRPFGDTQLAIVDPQTARRVAEGEIGEIWVAGRSCTHGYWRNPQATADTFDGRLADEPGVRWLRTGDLGFFADGHLYITGRLRELIIVAGRNHFPSDLEQTVESADEVIAPTGAAAFSIQHEGVERLVIAAEVRREHDRAARGQQPPAFDAAEVLRRIRAAVVAEHDVAPHELLLLRHGSLPRTTSGKLSRNATREAYLRKSLQLFSG